MDQIEAAMNVKYLSKILGTPVEDVKVTFGSNPGDNYMCVIYGLEARLANGEKRSLVVKAFPNQAARQQMLEMTNVFSKEYMVYDYWLPAFKNLQKDSDDKIEVSAPTYLDGAAVDHAIPKENKTTDEKAAVDMTSEDFRLDNFLLMDDVRLDGFKMANRLKGLDVDHCRLVITELAKFHALGWAYKIQNSHDVLQVSQKYAYLVETMFKPEVMDSFKGVFDALIAASDKMVSEVFGEDSPICKNYKEFLKLDTPEVMRLFVEYPLYNMDEIEKFMRVKTEFPEGFCKDAWLTTCHGDCWVNNFLFRYNEDSKPEQVCLVDFQLMREACPTTDLAYFVYSSVDGATRNANLKDFLKLYHDTFIDSCRKLGVEPLPGFNYESLLIRFRQTKVFGMLIGMPLLFAVLKNPDKAEDLDTLELDNVGDIFAKGMNMNDENFLLKKRLGEIIQELYDDGVL